MKVKGRYFDYSFSGLFQHSISICLLMNTIKISIPIERNYLKYETNDKYQSGFIIHVFMFLLFHKF